MSELLPVIDDCWNAIGVHGDRSCSKLKAAIHCHNCGVFGQASQTFFDRARTLEYETELTAIVADVPQAGQVDARLLLLFAIGREAFRRHRRVRGGRGGPHRPSRSAPQ